METITKALLIVGGVAVAGAAAAAWLRRRSLPITLPTAFHGLPSQPWRQEEWKEFSRDEQKDATQRWYDEAGYGIMTDVGDLVNAYNGERDAGKALGRGLYRQHRTLQSEFFRALPFMLKEYTNLADQFGTDARNEHAVKLARKLEKCTKDEPLPFI